MPALIGLGSNLGDREANIAAAVRALRGVAGVRVVKVSRVRRTAPVGYRRQPRFANAAALLSTRLAPAALLTRLLAIERRLGRRRGRGPRYGPRMIDLDLLLHGGAVRRTGRLTLPHPRFHLRAFALRPAAEVAGGLTHPVAGVTVRALWRRLRGR